MKKTLMLLILLSSLSFTQTIKVTALPSATKIDRTDLLLLTQPATGTPVSKKITFQTLIDSAQVIVFNYAIQTTPINANMLNSTDLLSLPLFNLPELIWQDSINSAMNKIDDAVIFFDPNDFVLSGDTLQLNTILVADTLLQVETVITNNDTTLATSGAIVDYVKKSVDSLNTLNKLTNVAYKGQTNNFGAFTQTASVFNSTSAIQLNGTSINTTGTLSNVAYKGQNNAFTTSQTINGNLFFDNPGQTRYILGTTSTGSDDGGIAIAPNGGALATARGAYFVLSGANRATNAGNVYLTTASNAGAKLEIAHKGGVRISVLDDSPTDVVITGNIKASGTITGTNHIAGSANYFYLGDPTTDGSWRIGRSGNNLVSERRESGTWVTKQTITP